MKLLKWFSDTTLRSIVNFDFEHSQDKKVIFWVLTLRQYKTVILQTKKYKTKASSTVTVDHAEFNNNILLFMVAY